MPGVAFHLAWCIIMISIVKDLWVAVEVEKHKAKKLAKERGVNVPDRVVAMGDLFATIYKLLGIDWRKES